MTLQALALYAEKQNLHLHNLFMIQNTFQPQYSGNSFLVKSTLPGTLSKISDIYYVVNIKNINNLYLTLT